MCEKWRETTFHKAGQENGNVRWNAAFWKTVQDSAVTYRHSVGELRQGGIDRRWNVKFIGSAQLSPKREKAHCWLSQQAFPAFHKAFAQQWSNGGQKSGTLNTQYPCGKILQTKAVHHSSRFCPDHRLHGWPLSQMLLLPGRDLATSHWFACKSDRRWDKRHRAPGRDWNSLAHLWNTHHFK